MNRRLLFQLLTATLVLVSTAALAQKAVAPLIVKVTPQPVLPGETIRITLSALPEATPEQVRKDLAVQVGGRRAEVTESRPPNIIVATAAADTPTGKTVVGLGIRASYPMIVAEKEPTGVMGSATAFLGAGVLLLLAGGAIGVWFLFKKARGAQKEAEELRSRLQQRDANAKKVSQELPRADVIPSPTTLEGIEKTNAKRSLSEDVQELYLPKEVPPDLIDACTKAECVLYAGAGLSAQSGLPTWSDFVKGLLSWALANGFINEAAATSYRGEVDGGQADPVADGIVSRVTTEDQQSALNSYLRDVFLGRSSPSVLHFQLERIKFSAVLTTNFDNLLEGVYNVNNSQVYTPRDAEPLLAALTRRDFFILKLYGTLDKPDTVMVAPAQYENAITSNSLFSEFMQTLFFSRTILFVGASLEGIEAYLTGISLPRGAARRHYALVAVTDRAWRAKAELLERRYGIKVLPFTPKSDYAELTGFLNKLTEAVAARQDVTTDGKHRVSRLKRITLENIGPFENLTLELDLGFDHKWHIFLGDNGVGKSTVLKAIALALCGKEAQQYAGRLLRDKKKGDKISPADKTIGTIRLETDNKTSYLTTIQRDEKSGQVELISTTARPLEAEGWLAIGFPPLRTTSWKAPTGPEADIKIKSRPVVSDLLPLVAGEVDPRLDKLKQWIVNLDYLDVKSKNPGGHYRNLIQKVFDIIGSVAEGMKLTYVGVGEGNRVLVKTEDGTLIPLEALSQGTISLIGWIGILMQRLYEVFDKDEDPTQRYALVLMDEIDAHMHPLWQRTLVTHLKDLFPQAQFIATTHSPLVVGGMPAQQVVRFTKDKEGKAIVLSIAPDMTLGYTDQVLTSLLFGLPTSLDRTTEKKKKRYYELYKMKDRGGDEAEYETLKQELMARVPPPSASYDEKHAKQLAEAELLTQLGQKLSLQSSEEGQVLLDRANKLREMIGGGQSNDQS
jgi:predicted ATPase